jgi:3-hydroxybutyryl-CoA dehydrogenase
MDLIGLEQLLRINEYIVPDLDAVAEAPPLLRELVARGHTGARAGQGFYEWDPAREAAARARMDALLIEGLKLIRRLERDPAFPAGEET